MLAPPFEKDTAMKLKNDEIMQLARCMNPDVGRRASDKSAAEKRLIQELEAKIGRKVTDEELQKLRDCDSFLEAHHIIGDIIEPGSSSAPPKPERKEEMPDVDTKDKPKATKASKGTIHPKVTENPRRAGTHGFNSMKIILKNPGLTYEQFIERGGRPQDLRWDIDKGNVELKGAA